MPYQMNSRGDLPGPGDCMPEEDLDELDENQSEDVDERDDYDGHYADADADRAEDRWRGDRF